MRWMICFLFLLQGLRADIREIKQFGQTFINEQLFQNGLIFEILMDNLSAVKCIDKGKIYLKSDRIVPSEGGMMLIADDSSYIFLPQILSDEYGCFLQSTCMSSLTNCLNCGYQFQMGTDHICCPRCNSESP